MLNAAEAPARAVENPLAAFKQSAHGVDFPGATVALLHRGIARNVQGNRPAVIQGLSRRMR